MRSALLHRFLVGGCYRFVMFLAVCLLWANSGMAQDTAVIGDMSNGGEGSFSYKLNAYSISTAGCIELVRFAPYIVTDANEEATFVLYEETEPGSEVWNLLWSDEMTFAAFEGFTDSDAINLPLYQGHVYAMGVFLLADTLRYFWESDIAQAPMPWGRLEGSVWATNNTTSVVVDPLYDGLSVHGYYQQLVTQALSDCDSDGHGLPDDCDDSVSSVFPGAPELCNGLDDDCDQMVDEGATTTYYLDADGDGFGGDSTATEMCAATVGFVDAGGDCDDDDRLIHPQAMEGACSTLDRDCDGDLGDPDACAEAEKLRLLPNCNTSQAHGVLPACFAGLFLLWGAVRRR